MRHPAYASFLPFLLLFTLGIAQHTVDHFNWQTLEAGMVKVHWYEGDLTFGQEALETAQLGLTAVERLVPLSLETPVEFFIYTSADDLHEALVPGNEGWVAGHANPELGIVRVLIEPGPGQGIAMEQRIPHELMHIMLYRHVGAGYEDLPAWLREGMATLVEMYPNLDYERVLREAAGNKTLIPLKDLCVVFPNDTIGAFLAYAESRSFVNYLHTVYGSAGLLKLVRSYAGGEDCQGGTDRAFGLSLSNLESGWRSSALGEKTFASTLEFISPYLVLLCLVLLIPMLGIAGTLRKGKPNESGTELRK